MNPKKMKIITFALLAIIVLIGFYIRSQNVFKRGLILRDEALYLFRVQSFVDYISKSLHMPAFYYDHATAFYRVNNPFNFLDLIDGSIIQSKPLYALFVVFLALLFWPISFVEFPTCSLSIFCGTLSIIAVYFLSKVIWKNRIQGIIAAGFFAISPLNVYLSRVGTPYAVAELLFLIFLIWHLAILSKKKAEKEYIHIFLGIFFGLIISIHPFMLVALIAYSMSMFLLSLLYRSAYFTKSMILICAGVFFTMCIWEIIYASGIACIQKGLRSTTGSYFSYIFLHGSEASLKLSSFPYKIATYLSMLVSIEGVMLSILCGITVVTVLKKQISASSVYERLLVFFGFFVLLFSSFSWPPIIRCLAAIFPLGALLGSAGLYRIVIALRKKLPKLSKTVPTLISMGVLAHSAILIHSFFTLDGPWKQIGTHIRTYHKNKTIAVSGNGVNTFFEIGDCSLLGFYAEVKIRPPVSMEDFFSNYDLYVYNLPSYHNDEYKSFKKIYKEIVPIAQYRNKAHTQRLFLALKEGWPLLPSYQYLFSQPRLSKRGDDTIRIYNVKDIERQFKKLAQEDALRVKRR